jgi:hypothetical protein
MCSVAVRVSFRASVIASLGATLLLLSACGGHYVTRGTALYEDAHYVEAAEVFEQTEGRLSSSSTSERARFGLYRGATYLKLGDVGHAARWLGYARSMVKSDPDALNDDDLALLGTSLKALGPGASEAPAHPGGAEVATAPPASQAAPSQ